MDRLATVKVLGIDRFAVAPRPGEGIGLLVSDLTVEQVRAWQADGYVLLARAQ